METHELDGLLAAGRHAEVERRLRGADRLQPADRLRLRAGLALEGRAPVSDLVMYAAAQREAAAEDAPRDDGRRGRLSAAGAARTARRLLDEALATR